MPAVAHDLDREINWVPYVFQAGDPARAQLGAFHHTRIQLHHTVKVETRPDAGVEEGLVFHEPARRNDRGERTVTDREPAGVASSLDGGLPEMAFPLGHRPGAAGEESRRPGRGPVRVAA